MKRVIFVLSIVSALAMGATGLHAASAASGAGDGMDPTAMTGPDGAPGDDEKGAEPESGVQSTQMSSAAVSGADSITICSFDGTRSNRALSTSSSYSVMRGALLDLANFGPGGVDDRPVTIRPGVPALTPANLEGCDVLMAQELFGALSPEEGSALLDAYNDDLLMVVVESDSSNATIEAANSVISALGRPAGIGYNGIGGLNSATGGTIPADAPDRPANGPFGDIRGGTFATSTSATVLKFGVKTVLSAGEKVRKSKGRILIGGDPSGLDLFTSPVSQYYNPNNLTMYLNFIAATPRV